MDPISSSDMPVQEGYATFAQMDLFSSPFRPPTAPVYAILLHGGPPDAFEPSFAVVRFPVSDASAYLDDQINLIERYPDALGRAPSVPSEVIEDTISITVRREKGTAEEGA